jgi:hypothetical protein
MVRMKRVFGVAAIVLIVFALSPAAQARLVANGAVCIERTTTPEFEGRMRDAVQAPAHDELSRWIRQHPTMAGRSASRAGAPVIVPVYFHVIRKNLTVSGGNVPLSRINAQMDVLNDSYAGRTGGANNGFRFDLKRVTRTTNAGWFNLTGYGQDLAMKTALKVGGTDALNIYSAKLGANFLGYAYLAQDADEVGVLDGMVVHFQSLPGGSFSIYSEGDTATHEVGHWFDLLHTFEGGCEGGDFVADTAPEASPAFHCPEGRDTCKGDGLDPITNFMDYSQDSCMFEFTPGQSARMQQAWTAYRA